MENNNAVGDKTSKSKINHKSKADRIDRNKKTAFDNQWVSTGLKSLEDNRERRDGPGGEDGNI